MSESLVQYGTSFQSKLIGSLMMDVKYTTTIIDILDVSYFDSDANKFLVKSIKDYFLKYTSPPTIEALKVLIDTVREYCMQEFAAGIGEAEFGLPPISIDLTDYWINVMPPGSYQRIHSHFNSNLSGTFYLQAPEQSGDLYIPSPYINGIENIITTASEYIIPPKVREGWLHPSSLPHYVSRNESDEDRVSISYNLKLKNI